MDKYYDWGCTKCGECVCKAMTAKNPDTYVNFYGKHTYACRNGYIAEWVRVRTHIRHMQRVRACVQ